jgi:hypothetical protein
VAKRPRFSRWRRLPGVYRFGDRKAPEPDQELRRLSVYVPWSVLDLAERQAGKLGFATAQDYCTDLLLSAIDAAHVREQMADVEARRGPLEGLNAIADDPEYLAELSNASGPKPVPEAVARIHPASPEVVTPWAETSDDGSSPSVPLSSLPSVAIPIERSAPMALSPSARVVLRHAVQAGAESDPYAFLSCLRRGEPVPPSAVAELAQALQQLEVEYQSAAAMDRTLTFALHRLAFESQILHTDAWPGTFDGWTVEMLRAVQEAVERILSGQDIRYYNAALGPSSGGGLDDPVLPTSETPL